jgi:hypothetical protein
LKSRGSIVSRGSERSIASSASFRSTVNRFSDRSCNRSVQGRIDEATNGKLNGSFSDGRFIDIKLESIKRRSKSTVIRHTHLPEHSTFPYTKIKQPDSAPVGTYEVNFS